MDEYELLKLQLLELLSIVEMYSTEEFIIELKEYINHNECGLAFEDICDVIKIYNILIDLNVFTTIRAVGEKLNYCDSFINEMKQFIKN